MTLSLNPDSVSEDASATAITVTASLNNSPLATATEITVSLAEGTATSGMDYAVVSDFTVTIAGGQTSGTAQLSFDPTQDNVAEGNETVILSGSAAGLTAGTATLTITDDDPAPTAVTLSLNPNSVSEDASPTAITVTASLNNSPLPTATEVTVSLAGGTATSGTDYAVVSEFTMTIAGGQTSGTAQLSFDPTQDNVAEGNETVILSGSAAGLDAGTATLTIADDDPVAAQQQGGEAEDDYPADTSTGGSVAVGQEVIGKLDFAGDRDWFSVELERDHTYHINQVGNFIHLRTLIYGIHDQDSNFIDGTADEERGKRGSGSESHVVFTPGADGTYFVAAGGDNNSENNWPSVYLVGHYKLSVIDVTNGHPDDTYTDDTGTTGTVEVNGHVESSVDFRGDRDWFAVTLESGVEYLIVLLARGLDDPYLVGIYDGSGTLIADTSDEDSGAKKDSGLIYSATRSGTHHISAAGSENHQGMYRLEVWDNTDDYSADTSTTGTLAAPGQSEGRIEQDGDRDWFSVSLEADVEYVFNLLNRGLHDPHLQGIYNESGVLFDCTQDSDGGHGLNSRVLFTPGATGTYYVAAAHGEYPEDELDAYTYTLSVSTGTDDYSANACTKGSVEVEGSVTGEIEESGDQDWFAVSLQKNRIYQFDLKGAPTGDGTMADPYLYGLYDSTGPVPTGLRLTDMDDAGVGLNSRLVFRATRTGTHYVVVGGTSRWETDLEGTYELSVTENIDACVGDAGTSCEAEVGGGMVTSQIEASDDEDWFEVTLRAGRKYAFALKGSWDAHGTLDDPYLTGIYDSDGTLIDGTSNDDTEYGPDSLVEFAVTQSGTYYVAAGSDGAGTGTYKLWVEDCTGW